MKKIFFLLLSFLVLSCQNNETQKITIQNLYEIELPKTLSKADNLHEDASLQYQNLFSEFYTIVINEPSNDFDELISSDPMMAENYTADLNGYSAILKDNLMATVEDGKFSEIKKTTINGLPARLMNLSGTVDDIPVYYVFAFLKGRNQYYQIVNWTELKRKEDHAASMEKIIASFKEINRSKKKMP